MDEKGWRNSGEVKIELPYKALSEINLSGSGSIVADGTVKSDNLKISISGSGDINLTVNSENAVGEVSGSGDLTLNGKTTNFQGRVTGSGDLKAFGLKAENTNIDVAGSGDAEVYASENIKARVVGSGDIKYKGNPKQEDTKVAGSGEIEKA
ncbi:head GIN domain-containing protein [Flavobacterium sp. 3HN19-14]|uniref:head GIN domain-containing protein n=1 Tax=Flavobacterium sp. 3HN19-14 TaxID=3448133 RepID=UPI003EE280C9